MKILAIRGENLASLQGAFSVDLSEPPFDRAGLFAITGPTGAGKSTLLDAICLALYGTTPRMHRGRGHVVGGIDEENRVQSNDARTLLRKGCGEGFAEVEFHGRDGKTYRARWSVRRARGKADGRLQHAAAELWDVATGAQVGGSTRKEVFDTIEQKVGLSYDQFCRSVLLAQGDFARFLLAGEKERAELLERVTGTEIYRRISILAHERLAEEKKALELLQRELDGVEILPPGEREALELAVVEREKAKKEAEKALSRAQADLHWHQRQEEFVAKQAEADKEALAAETAWVEAAAERAELEAVEKVLPLQPLWVGREAAGVAATRALAEREKAAARRDGAEAARKEQVALASEARERLQQVRVEIEGEQPALEQARRLDTRIEGARRQQISAHEGLERVKQQAGTQREEVTRLEGALQQARGIREEATSWLASNEPYAVLAPQWERWREEAIRFVDGSAQVASLSAGLAASTRQLSSLRERLEGIEARSSVAQAGLVAATQELGLAQSRLDALPKKAWRELREILQREEQEAASLQGTWDGFRRISRELEQRRALLAASRATEVEAGKASDSLEGRWRLLSEQVREAEDQLQQARTVLALEGHRSELREGEACPLCGSKDHPFATEAIRVDERVRERAERLEALTRSREETQGELARSKAAHEAAAKSTGHLSSEIEGLEAEVGVAREAFQGRVGGLLDIIELRRSVKEVFWPEAPGESPQEGEPSLACKTLPAPEADLWPSLFATWATERKTAREALSLSEQGADRLESQVQKARVEVEARRREIERQATEKDEAKAALQKEELQARDAETRLGALRSQIEVSGQLLSEVLGSFDGWDVRLAQEGRRFIDSLSTAVDTWRKSDAARLKAETWIGQLEPLLEKGKQLLAERVEAEAVAARLLAEATEELSSMVSERKALFDGRAVAEVEKAHKLRLDEAGEAVTRAQGAVTVAEATFARVAAEWEAATRDVTRTGEEKEQREGEWRLALEGVGFAEEQILAWLRTPAETLSAWRRSREEGEKRLARAKALAEQRGEDRSRHEAAEKPAVDREQALLAQQEAHAAREAATESWHDAKKTLELDDRAREKNAAILPRITAQQAEALKWEKLHELIGAASGDKFQLFAQSLTLEALLSHANVHLAELAPRYRLERVPNADLELQIVDRDMADEIRPVNSLSGGESFLVSLALALGLSGLSARNTQVESLFIDEGFGTLDPQTLDTALATLDALQASGRKVGVISHVQGMAERIGVQIRVVPKGRGTSRVEVFVQ